MAIKVGDKLPEATFNTIGPDGAPKPITTAEAFGGKKVALFAVPGDVFPSRDVATVWGMSGAAGSVAAALSQPVIGFIIDRTGSYEIVFMLVSSMHIVSALCVTLLIPRIEPLALARREP